MAFTFMPGPVSVTPKQLSNISGGILDALRSPPQESINMMVIMSRSTTTAMKMTNTYRKPFLQLISSSG